MKYFMKTVAVLLTFTFAAGASAQMTHDVDVGPGFVFTPADITIFAGDTVRWTWMGGFHNVESGVGGVHDGVFRSGDPTSVAGTTFEVTFDEAFLAANPMPDDTYPYYCVVHVGLGMFGSVNVITCPGDLDGDGVIGLGDLGIMLANYGATSGATYDEGDLDFDGDIDLTDLAILLDSYGQGCS